MDQDLEIGLAGQRNHAWCQVGVAAILKSRVAVEWRNSTRDKASAVTSLPRTIKLPVSDERLAVSRSRRGAHTLDFLHCTGTVSCLWHCSQSRHTHPITEYSTENIKCVNKTVKRRAESIVMSHGNERLQGDIQRFRRALSYWGTESSRTVLVATCTVYSQISLTWL